MKIKTVKIKWAIDFCIDKNGNECAETVNCRARIIRKKGYNGEGKYIVALVDGIYKENFCELKYKRKPHVDAYCGLRKIGKKWYFYGAE